MSVYIGENIKKLRKERELTQEVLANFLGVSYQSVSKWERGDSYPDITLLPEIAGFFKVSVDELLGVNKAEDEAEIIKELEAYDNIRDKKLKQEIISRLKEKFPNDFRILLRYMSCLVHFEENTPENVAKIIAIYENIKQNCNNDKIRISAKRHIIEFYKGLSEKEGSGITFEDCEKIIKEMPRMRDGQEMFCFYYPENYPNGDEIIMNTLEEQFLLLNTVYSHYFHYNGFFYDRNFSDEWVLSAFKTELDFLNFVYDDGHYGKMWRTVIYNYGHLGVRYFKLGDTANALENFRKMCELAIKFDNMDRITTMHSVMFEGNKFDKHTLGSTYVAKMQIKELLTEKYPLSDEFKASAEFKEILDILK
ncbi:MAG: helix-turn-helix transcriptional regulator [Ruminococcaceae bacterium]|nr:helix-turn-helix transcriptional regulator [Oscillospiraceae bacterium]